MNADAERVEHDATGKFHTVQPHRDLQSNWYVDLAKNLEEYLLKICSGEITSGDHDTPHLSVNFAEAALLLQGSVQVYSRKVEYLYSLVLHALEFISQKGSQEEEASASVQSEGSGSRAPREEKNDSFWDLDVPAEAKNLLDSLNGKDSPVNLSVKPPANLVVLEGDCLDAICEAGELESYLLATNDLFRDFILLDSCDAAVVNDYLNSENKASKSNFCRGSSITSKSRRGFHSPSNHSCGTGHKSARNNQDVDVNNLTSLVGEFKSNNCNIEASPPANDFPEKDGNDFGLGNEHSDFSESDDSDSADLWKPLNPHEPGNLKVKPYKKVKAKKRQGLNGPKHNPIMVEFPLARLDGPISAELRGIWETKLCESQRRSETQSPPLYEQLRQSLVQGGNEKHNPFGNFADNNKDNEYGSEDSDSEPPDLDMPDDVSVHEDLPQNNNDGRYGFDANEVNEDANNHANLEDLCRSHLDSLLASLAETERQTELAARVSTWKQRIEQNLEEQDSHPAFDIHEYGARVLGKLYEEGDTKKTMSFGDVVKGQEKHDVARSFSALLQLVNNGDVELEQNIMDGEPLCHTAENPFYVHLLRNEKPNDQVLHHHSSKKRAKSPKGCAKTYRKNSSKENQPVVNTSSSLSISGCILSMHQGKPVGSRCTPEGKKRRKSRFLEQVNMPSPR